MPDLPPTVYVPVIVALSGAVGWCIHWARQAEKEKDGIQDKWIAFQEKQIPIQIQQNLLMERMLAWLDKANA